VNGLGILVGRPPQSITVTPGTLSTLSLPEVAPGLPSELLERRPDVASAEAQLIAANANIRSARANFFPQVTLTGQAGLQSTALTSLFNPGSELFSLAGSVTQTIFDNGLKRGQYEQYKGKYDELVADYRKAVVQAFTDVQNGLDSYRLATEQEDLERQAVAVAQRAADIAKAQVAAGTSDIVTALQAENTLFTDLDTLAQVRLTRFQALLNLYKALGGGWSKSDVKAPPSTIYHGIL
jgi:NodT family efflux transporter outer membrane factor (OMF) lipoprotein